MVHLMLTNRLIFGMHKNNPIAVSLIQKPDAIVYCLNTNQTIPYPGPLLRIPVYRQLAEIRPSEFTGQQNGITILPLKAGEFILKTVAVQLGPEIEGLPLALRYNGYDKVHGLPGQVFVPTSQLVVCFSTLSSTVLNTHPIYKLETTPLGSPG